MRRFIIPAVVVGLWTLGVPGTSVPAVAARQSPTATPSVANRDSSATAYRATLDKYCVTCHNQKAKTAGLTLDAMDLTEVPAHAEEWEKVIRKLRTSTMPPAGVPQPEEPARMALASWLEGELDRAARTPRPGRALLHRLNRAEYGNAIRDLLDIDIDVKSLL